MAATALVSSRLAVLTAATFAMAAGACGFHPRPDTVAGPLRRDEIVVTREQIARLGARTAWEVVKRRVPGLTYRENSSGQPTSITRHGHASIYLDDTPLLFVDGVRVADIRALDDIPADDIEIIRIRTGLNSSAEYGTNSSGGVILIETKTGV